MSNIKLKIQARNLKGILKELNNLLLFLIAIFEWMIINCEFLLWII